MTAPAEARDMALAAIIELHAFDMAIVRSGEPEQFVGLTHLPHRDSPAGCDECRSLREFASEVSRNSPAKNEEEARHWLLRLAVEGMSDADPHQTARAYLSRTEAAHGVQLLEGADT